MTNKIVINNCHGGFGLSDEATEHYAKIKGLDLGRRDSKWAFSNEYEYFFPETGESFHSRDIERDDPALIQTVQDIGSESGGRFASLKIVEIPDDVKWQIDEYDGLEWVAEQHRTWS
jgi:hypothetical protein